MGTKFIRVSYVVNGKSFTKDFDVANNWTKILGIELHEKQPSKIISKKGRIVDDCT